MTASATTNMIKQQLRTMGVMDARILSLFETIPRAAFAPSGYQAFAYTDMHIPLAHGQVMMTPAEEGLLLQSLQLQGTETVLEVGTGTGFLTTLLSHLCKKVISIDVYTDLIDQAKPLITQHGKENVTLLSQNAYDGYPEKALFDCIIFTSGRPNIPDTLRAQLNEKGRLFAIIGKAPVMQARLYTAQRDTFLFNTCLPPLVQLHLNEVFSF